MKILVTGALGYIGYPLVLELLEKTPNTVIGVDNDSRNGWVEKCGGRTHYPFYEEYGERYIGIRGDVADRNLVDEILAIHKPEVVYHLASQPSMPYSQINGERASYTQLNNIEMCLNLLWGMHEERLCTKFIITTTTGIPGQHYKKVPEGETLNRAGSWYHVSRGFDSVNCGLAARQWNQHTVEFRTAIVYGLQTETMRRLNVSTRYDTDPFFGTALNRFVKKAVDGETIEVYGKGEQTKPFISLEDTVQSLAKATYHQFEDKHTILNQYTEMISITKLAKMIQKKTGCVVENVKNPRVENETFKMNFYNKKFLEVLDKDPKLMEEGIKEMVAFIDRPTSSIVSYPQTNTIY